MTTLKTPKAPTFAFAMTVEDAIEMLPLADDTVAKLYRLGAPALLADAWAKLTPAQRREISAAAAREEAYAADIVARMLA